MRHLELLAIGLLSALILGGSRSAPGPKPPEAARRGPPVLSTPHVEEDVGREAAREASIEIGIVENPALASYVEAIGLRLARHAPGYGFDYEFRILDEDEPNAFALPGGYVFVSRGLLALSNSEDEVAGVLGHEIAHAALRHAAALQRVAGTPLLQVLQIPYLAGYSRDLERTADRVGQGLAALAGYDPNGISEFLRSLDGFERLRTGASRIPSFLDTHPGAVGRSADTAQRASAIAWEPAPGVAKDREDHLRRLDGLVVGESAAQGVFEGSRFLHPDLGFTLRFPDGWETRNTPRAVGAIAPDRVAQVFLEHAGSGSDPARAAVEWIEEARRQGVRVEQGSRIRVSGRDAYRVTGSAQGGGRALGLTVTFLPWRGQVYRLVGLGSSRHQPIFVSVARSFRPMTPELLARVRETHLRLAEALAGETLAGLGQRTGNAWSPARTALMNGLRTDHRFAGGELVKIGRAEPYRPEPSEQREDPGHASAAQEGGS